MRLMLEHFNLCVTSEDLVQEEYLDPNDYIKELTSVLYELTCKNFCMFFIISVISQNKFWISADILLHFLCLTPYLSVVCPSILVLMHGNQV